MAFFSRLVSLRLPLELFEFIWFPTAWWWGWLNSKAVVAFADWCYCEYYPVVSIGDSRELPALGLEALCPPAVSCLSGPPPTCRLEELETS